jgi:nitrite reductase/ring-hydroxylating ferredoxin subunit
VLRERVKVADLDELPPGRGKTITAFGHELTVVNREGRIVATAAEPTRPGAPLDPACEMPGHTFTVGPAVSPDRLQADRRRVEVEVHGGAVYVVVEET